jgi:hypothetical protein
MCKEAVMAYLEELSWPWDLSGTAEHCENLNHEICISPEVQTEETHNC